MAFFRRTPKTRSEIIAAADAARSRGRVKKAVEGYRQVLASDPSDPAVNVKLGPLLAKLGDLEGGARCFRTAAKVHLDAGFTDRAVAVNVAACAVFPLDAGFRLEIARLNLLRGRKQDSVATLFEGGTALAKARRWEASISLLESAREIEPWHLETCLALSKAFARVGRADEAKLVLDGLDSRIRGAARRRVRWAAFRLRPGFRTFWRWVGA